MSYLLFGTLALKGWAVDRLLMNSMKASYYAMLAVVFGILLIYTVPYQLSSVYSTSIQEIKRTDNNTLNGSDKKPLANITGGFESQFSTAKTWSVDTFSQDAGYYGLWALNLIIAVGIYFLSKKYFS